MPTAVIAYLAGASLSFGVRGIEGATGRDWLLGALTFGQSFVVRGIINSRKKPQGPGLQASTVLGNFSVRQAISPWQVVIGQRRVGGTITFISLSSDKKYLHMVATLACHVSEEIGDVWLDDEVITAAMLDGAGLVTSGKYSRVSDVARTDQSFSTSLTTTFPVSSVQSVARFSPGGSEGPDQSIQLTDVSPAAPSGPGQYSRAGDVFTFDPGDVSGGNSAIVDYTQHVVEPICRIQKSLGAETAQPFPDLVAESEGKWIDSDRQTGHTKIYIRFDTSMLQGNAPAISAVLKGAKLYDPRTGLTTWSANPALAILAYLTNAEWGRGAALAEIASAEAITAANICDESVSLSGGGSELRYRANGAFLTSERPIDILQGLLGAMGGDTAGLTHVSGTWRIFAGAYEAATLTLTEKDLAGGIQIDPLQPADKWINGAKGIFVDPGSNWQPTDFPPIVPTTTYLAEDGGETNYADLDFTDFVTSSSQAQRLARIAVRQARSGLMMTASYRLSAWQAFTGHSLAQNFAKYGWTGQEFSIMQSGFAAIQGGDGLALGVQMTLRQTNPAIFSWSAEDQAQPTPAHSNLPSPFTKPATITGLVATSGTADLLLASDGTVITRARVTWNAIADGIAFSGGHLELEYKRVSEGAFQRDSNLSPQATEQYLSGLEDGLLYLIRIRAVSALGVVGQWTTITHQVIGKTAPPSDVIIFTLEGTVLTWTPVNDVDVLGYLLRYQPGTSRSWGDAIPLHNGQITDSPYDMLVVPSGPVVLMIKAIDSSGNESQNAAYIVANFGDPLVANIVESWDRKAAGFPGIKTNCSVSAGNLVANSITPLMWKPDDSAAMWNADPSVPMWATTQYAQLGYFDTLSFSQAGAGSVLTIDSAIAGDPWSLEYRENSGKTMWSADASALMWGVDSGALMWDQPDFLPWPGQIAVRNSWYDFRVNAGQSNAQGVVSALTMIVDMPDIDEVLNNIVISSGGTRLPITKPYRAIKNVQLTVQADGGSAISARIDDKSATLGPLIHGLDAAGSNTGALIDARIQGY